MAKNTTMYAAVEGQFIPTTAYSTHTLAVVSTTSQQTTGASREWTVEGTYAGTDRGQTAADRKRTAVVINTGRMAELVELVTETDKQARLNAYAAELGVDEIVTELPEGMTDADVQAAAEEMLSDEEIADSVDVDPAAADDLAAQDNAGEESQDLDDTDQTGPAEEPTAGDDAEPTPAEETGPALNTLYIPLPDGTFAEHHTADTPKFAVIVKSKRPERAGQWAPVVFVKTAKTAAKKLDMEELDGYAAEDKQVAPVLTAQQRAEHTAAPVETPAPVEAPAEQAPAQEQTEQTEQTTPDAEPPAATVDTGRNATEAVPAADVPAIDTTIVAGEKQTLYVLMPDGTFVERETNRAFQYATVVCDETEGWIAPSWSGSWDNAIFNRVSKPHREKNGWAVLPVWSAQTRAAWTGTVEDAAALWAAGRAAALRTVQDAAESTPARAAGRPAAARGSRSDFEIPARPAQDEVTDVELVMIDQRRGAVYGLPGGLSGRLVKAGQRYVATALGETLAEGQDATRAGAGSKERAVYELAVLMGAKGAVAVRMHMGPQS